MPATEGGIYCAKCGTPSPADAVYCAKCGTKLPLLSEILRETESADVAKEPELVTPSQTTERVPISFGGPPSVFLKREVPVEGNVDEKFLKGYSFAPGCGLYFLNRVLWLFFLLNVLLGLLMRGCESVIETYEVQGDAVTAPMVMWSLILWFGWVAFYLWLGRIVRKKRWEGLKWRSFSHFRSDERAWNIAGIIGWILVALGFVFSLAAGFIEGFTDPYG